MNPVLEQRLARSANWFYWIAGLSVVNVFAAKSNYEFVLGSGAVEAAPAFGPTAAIVIDVCVIGGFAILGFLASRRHTWAFILGMVLYALDGVIFLVAQDWIAAAFHAFVLYVLFLGAQASIAINRMPVESRTMVMPHANPTADGPAPPPSP
ncbi:MAG TPA: hypothetical protein VFO25_04305 [Candidatus Eremiobacteraceae bacterium]|nr:hypothetical protein [Candidatus Eremiobacteraceae bacterium]